MAKITFSREKTVDSVDSTKTLLELSLEGGIPHMCVCGGNAKCSTCRVLVVEGADRLSEPTAAEWKLAARKGFDPGIRLACQARPLGDVTVRRLVIDELDADVAISEETASQMAATTGRELPVAILFTDVRDFTPFVDASLPYDVIHLLDRFFRLAGEAVIGHDGFIDKYMGDGMMALFGLDGGDPRTVCNAAVGAGLEITKRVAEQDAYTRQHFNTGFRVGVGVHYGPALVGIYGHPSKMQFSAIGDSVNVASRVESATKEVKGTSLLVSDAVFDALQNDVHVARVVRVPLKGKAGDHVLYQIDGLLTVSLATMPEPLRLLTIKRALRRIVTRRTAPLFLRLSYHDAITFDPLTGEGGADGSIRFPEELARDSSRGLDIAIKLLGEAKEHLPEVSWADLVAVAGAVAVARTGGPDIKVPLGRKDATAAVKDGMMPSRDWDAPTIQAYFARLGFDARLWTALSGAHTLGRVSGKGFTDDPYTFDNSYYRNLVQRGLKSETMLKTDIALLQVDECIPWVQEYAMHQERFFADFTEAYLKMTSLGSPKSE